MGCVSLTSRKATTRWSCTGNLRWRGLAGALFAVSFLTLVNLPWLTPLPLACAAAGEIEGSWKVDVDSTMTANKGWRTAYDAATVQEQKQMRASWERKAMVVNLDKRSIRIFVNDTVSQEASIVSITERARSFHVVVAHKDDKASTYPIDFFPLSLERMRVVIDSYTTFVFVKTTNPEAQ